MSIPIDVGRLPPQAAKVLDPASPAPLKLMAAKGVVPGLKPGDVLAVLVLLVAGGGPSAEQAQKTLAALPAPLVNGALSAELQPGVLDAIAPFYASDPAMAERVVNHPNVDVSTIATMAAAANEAVSELIATNEERMLVHPPIIERLYLNKATRMSTADRILELAVRNNIELQIPAFEQAKAAIQGELISEPTPEPTFDDVQLTEALTLAKELVLAENEDTHVLDPETGKEVVVEKAKPLHALWADMRPPAKIRMLLLENKKEVRMLGVRDSNAQVARTVLQSPGINDGEVARIAKMRNVSEDILRDIASSKEWTRHYHIKKELVSNPRTPFGQASRFVIHLYESDLKTLAKSKDVSGAIQTAAKQQLLRKGKGG